MGARSVHQLLFDSAVLIRPGSHTVHVTGEMLFGLQTSLLKVFFICRNGNVGFWDKDVWIRGFFTTFFLPLLPGLEKQRKPCLFFLPFKCHFADGPSWLLHRRLMPTSPFMPFLTHSSRLLFVFLTCWGEMKHTKVKCESFPCLLGSFFVYT